MEGGGGWTGGKRVVEGVEEGIEFVNNVLKKRSATITGFDASLPLKHTIV